MKITMIEQKEAIARQNGHPRLNTYSLYINLYNVLKSKKTEKICGNCKWWGDGKYEFWKQNDCTVRDCQHQMVALSDVDLMKRDGVLIHTREPLKAMTTGWRFGCIHFENGPCQAQLNNCITTKASNQEDAVR